MKQFYENNLALMISRVCECECECVCVTVIPILNSVIFPLHSV